MSHIVLLRRSTGRQEGHRPARKQNFRSLTTTPHAELPQLLRCRLRPTPFLTVRHLPTREKIETTKTPLFPRSLISFLRRIIQRSLYRSWLKWLEVLRFQRAQNLQRSIFRRMGNLYLFLGFQMWLSVDRRVKQTRLMRIVVARMLRRQLAMAWIKWRETIRVHRILFKFVERIVRVSSMGLKWSAFKIWLGSLDKELIEIRPRNVLGYCDCVYRLGTGLHCRCSQQKHLLNRIHKLRVEVDASLTDAQKEKEASMAWPSTQSIGDSSSRRASGRSRHARRHLLSTKTSTFVAARSDHPGSVSDPTYFSASHTSGYSVRFRQSVW